MSAKLLIHKGFVCTPELGCLVGCLESGACWLDPLVLGLDTSINAELLAPVHTRIALVRSKSQQRLVRCIDEEGDE